MKKWFFVLLIFIWGCESTGVVSKDPVKVEKKNPDVVVIGSEIEGIYMARAAADEGLSVVVLDPRDQPGGQVLQGEMLFLDEPTDDDGKTLLQGRVKELFDQFKKGEIRNIDEFKQYYQSVLGDIPIESGITIEDIQTVQDEQRNKQRISSMTYRTAGGEQKTVEAKYWVENTDFVALSSKLSNNRIPGVETIFNASKDYMASSIMMKFKNVDWKTFQTEVNKLNQAERDERFGTFTNVTNTFTWGFGKVGASYKSSRDDLFLRGLNTLNQRNGEVLINALLIYDVSPDNAERVKEAVELGKKETESVLAHLRKELPGWENAEMNGFPEYLYIRDFDRYETEYVLTAADVMGGAMFWDNVSIAGYPLDIQGIKSHPWGVSLGNPDKYGMPLRSFQLKGYTNVLTAGKNVGASAAAYGSARIQANTSLAGEVIGIMLGQIDGKKELADLTNEDMPALHSYIKEKYNIVLSGLTANNKIADYSQEDIEKINKGHLVVKPKQ